MGKKKWVSLAMAFLMAGTLAGCADGGGSGKVELRFWASGMQSYTDSLQELTEQFNASQDEITVKFQVRPVDGYADTLQNVLSFSSAPDVFIMGDRYVKKWARMNLIAPLSEEFEADETLEKDEIWPTLVQRFRYDTEKNISEEDSELYAIPIGNNPSVIYYNRTAFEQMNIRVISKDYSDDLPEEEKHGFYRSGEQGTVPSKDETLVFNNRIPMTWEELVDLSMYLNRSYNAESPTDWGYYCHWWFNFGWSVGGDCIAYDEEEQVWKFTLGDKTRKTNAEGVELPSMYEALEFYINMIRTKDQGGWQLMPTQSDVDVLGNDIYFMTDRVAMLVDVSEKISVFKADCTFDWDIAPIPKHKDGVAAGHSQADGIAIWAKTGHKEAAYRFAQFIASADAQKKLAEDGLFVPNQRSVAYNDVYDKTDMVPANSRLLAEVSEYERPGDWTYMPDDAWINDWADLLNTQVRNNQMSLDEFFETVTDRVNVTLKRYQQ